MKHYRSKLDKEEKKKKEMAEDLEYLRNVEVPESQGGGRKFVVEKIEEEEGTDQKVKDAIASSMQSHRTTYHIRLAAYGQAGLETLDWPKEWDRYCMPTDGSDIRIFGRWFKTQVGIQMIVKDPKGNVYTRGVLTTLDPVIDMQNVDTLVIQAENTIDSYKGLLLSDNRDTKSSLKKTGSGIYYIN